MNRNAVAEIPTRPQYDSLNVTVSGEEIAHGFNHIIHLRGA